MPTETQTLIQTVLKKIIPSTADRARMETLAKALELSVSAACEENGIEAIVRVEGSLAKDTWLKEDPDIDVFMQLSPTIPRAEMGKIALKIARQATHGAKQVERFAEHPYLEAFVDDVRVNIVPCYATTTGQWLSATDRTPYHTNYINKHLTRPQHGEVRLLKKFLKGISVYGAEIKVGGFSGYLCELLVLACGSFTAVLETFANHKPKRVIDLENYYAERQREIDLLFPEPLVIVDPVDKARNVASAVQPQKLDQFVSASRAFLKAPNLEFFYPLKPHPLSVDELRQTFQIRGSTLLVLTIGEVKAVPDILWGQLHRTRKALHKQLELADFKVLRDSVWSQDNTGITVFVFELEQKVLADVKKHLGPPLQFAQECESYLAKYNANSEVISGPFLEEGRWVVELHRRHTDAAEMLQTTLASGGKKAGVADLIAKALKENFQVLVGDEIIEYYAYNEDLAVFLTEFLSGKPFWL
jgi:tRNA nucleotidyltransferase (CCA-adding enzyme)